MECPICYISLDIGETCKTSCDHTFHRTCLRTWYSRNTSCPMCRAPAPVPALSRPADGKCVVASCDLESFDDECVVCATHLIQSFQRFEVARRRMVDAVDKRKALVHQLTHIIRPTGYGPSDFQTRYNLWHRQISHQF
ncbi:hypothetical protein [Yellowstone lake phycodnavirus 3]|uniref:hypothetical protein n=1 Tax=Yellowstone lake phycodnavirus 3 TaxID=1586715 RepID=UPI0006EB9146|nr:hypothetical protein AR677_gp236 [Yellowstone lake phycodnavirus 3]BAT22735.1 hypothetical protein [Yellowstone lake phycodnavirus 3]